jgi:glucan 1,3-beta-glucosidase
MYFPLGLFAVVAALIGGVWSWLGAGVAMPPSPLAAGEKLYCISYAPFRDDQNPLNADTHVSAQQIDEDLARLAQVTNCVRSYSIEHGLDQIPEIAARHGLKVMQGIWLSSHPEKNRKQIDTVIDLARRFPDTISAVVVGNEVLLRGEMSAINLAATIREVKSKISAPVTYADVWEFWLRNRDLYAAVDFVTIHILPYWEDFPIDAAQAAAHVEAIRKQVATAFPDKEILIGETGWPSEGRMREGALPSPSNQARVLHDILTVAKANKYRVNVIEAFDQPWKRRLEGTVGGHWGLLGSDTRARKFVWGEPVSDHPHWRAQAAFGAGTAAVIFLVAGFAGGGARLKSRAPWLRVALFALVGGTFVGWSAEKAWFEALGLGGSMRSLALLAIAAIAPMVAAAGVMRDLPLPSFAAVLAGEGKRLGPLARGIGLVFAIVCVLALQSALGLVFDPRYRDFPFAALTAAAIPYLALAWRPRAGDGAGVAEKATAGTLALSVIYIVLNEGFANWQALWLAATFVALIAALLGPKAARS